MSTFKRRNMGHSSKFRLTKPHIAVCMFFFFIWATEFLEDLCMPIPPLSPPPPPPPPRIAHAKQNRISLYMPRSISKIIGKYIIMDQFDVPSTRSSLQSYTPDSSRQCMLMLRWHTSLTRFGNAWKTCWSFVGLISLCGNIWSKIICIHQMIMKNKRIIHWYFSSRSASYKIIHKYTQKIRKNNWGRNVLGAEMTRSRSVGWAEMTGAEVTGAEVTGAEMVWGRSV